MVFAAGYRSVRSGRRVCRSENFRRLFADPGYLASFGTTLGFRGLVTACGLLLALLFAALVDHVLRAKRFYQTLLLPYAVAPAVAAVLWLFLFSPGFGLISYWLNGLGYEWNHARNAGQAMLLVVVISV